MTMAERNECTLDATTNTFWCIDLTHHFHRSITPVTTTKRRKTNKQQTNINKTEKGIKHATATTDTKNKTRKLWTQTNNSRKNTFALNIDFIVSYIFVYTFASFSFTIMIWLCFGLHFRVCCVQLSLCFWIVGLVFFGVLSLASSVLPVRPSCASMIIIMMMKLKQHSTN